MADELFQAKVGSSSASSSRVKPAQPKASPKGTSESPRSVAHGKVLAALSNLDADALRKAIHEAAMVGIDEEGLAAVQTALQELEAPGSIGTLAERQRAAAKLEVLAQDGTEAEIQDAILEAIDVGLEDGFAVAEAALAKRRSERHDLMDSLVAAMEVVVISAEQDGVNGPGCCAPEQLEALADILVEARIVAIPGEEELLNAATRLLEFELKRSEAVRTLNVRLRQHARDMEKIVDDFQGALGVSSLGLNAPSQRATAKLEEVLESKEGTPQWQRQSFLRRGSRRTKTERTVADEAPALPGAGVEIADLRPDLKALAANSGPLASLSRPSTPTPRSKASPASPVSPVSPVAKTTPVTTLSPRSSTLGYPKQKAAFPSAPEIPRPMQAQPRAQSKAETSPVAASASASFATPVTPASSAFATPAASAASASAAPTLPTATVGSAGSVGVSPAKAPPKMAGIQIGRGGGTGVPIGKAKSSASPDPF